MALNDKERNGPSSFNSLSNSRFKADEVFQSTDLLSPLCGGRWNGRAKLVIR